MAINWSEIYIFEWIQTLTIEKCQQWWLKFQAAKWTIFMSPYVTPYRYRMKENLHKIRSCSKPISVAVMWRNVSGRRITLTNEAQTNKKNPLEQICMGPQLDSQKLEIRIAFEFFGNKLGMNQFFRIWKIISSELCFYHLRENTLMNCLAHDITYSLNSDATFKGLRHIKSVLKPSSGSVCLSGITSDIT